MCRVSQVWCSNETKLTELKWRLKQEHLSKKKRPGPANDDKVTGFNSILSAGQFAHPLMEFCSSTSLKWTINMSLGKNMRLSHSCFWRVKRAFLLPHSQETPNVCCLLRGYWWGLMSFAFYYSVKIHLKWMAITWVSKSTWDWSSKIIAGIAGVSS